MSRERVFWLVVLGLIVAIVLTQCNADEGPTLDVGDEVSAWVMCQQFLEERLKAPATADYPADYSQYTRSLGGGRFQVDAFVDAENSFGAMIRTDFSCTVSYQGDDRWRLESLTVEE